MLWLKLKGRGNSLQTWLSKKVAFEQRFETEKGVTIRIMREMCPGIG